MSESGSGAAGTEARLAIRELPRALERREEILRRLGGGRPLLCLDYDGTLTPVVEHPDLADLSDRNREVLRRLARRWPVAVVSGRDAEEVRARVGVEGIHYAGNHGLEMVRPGGRRETRGGEAMEGLDRADAELRRRLSDVDGAWVERKRFGLAVHFRQAEPGARARIVEAVREQAEKEPSLAMTTGKQVVELRPDVEWDKGRAVERLVELLTSDDRGGDGPVIPVYIGDDVTDEDGFRAVRDDGIGIAVRGESDERRTLARYALGDPEEVRRFLRTLVEDLDGGPGDEGDRAGAPADAPRSS